MPEYSPQQHLSPREVLNDRARQSKLIHPQADNIRALSSLMAVYQFADKNKISRQLAFAVWSGFDA